MLNKNIVIKYNGNTLIPTASLKHTKADSDSFVLTFCHFEQQGKLKSVNIA